MLFAIDEKGNRIHISHAQRAQDYTCPCCGEKVLLKRGEIRAHHFAHCSGTICRDGWHYDMSAWHIEWQNNFPLECQEIVKELNGRKHRADVLLEDKKVVLEFQHSALSSSEFYERNSFYNALGYKVIWIFDAIEQYLNGQIDNYKPNSWSWSKYRKTFDNFNCKDKGVEVYLQIDHHDLIKVTWCTEDNGFSQFATDGKGYTVQDIVDLFKTIEPFQINEWKLSELYDELIELYRKDHTTYYFGCPISTTHMCANCNADIPKNEYKNIMPCTKCSFECPSITCEGMICKKRFLDLGLSGDIIVQIENKNQDGFIDKLSYIHDGQRKYIELPTFKQNISKDVFTLWKENNYNVASFRNVKTGIYIKIIQNPIVQLKKYGKVYGYFSSEKYSFPQKSVELFGLGKSEWICVWFRKNN